MNDGYSSASSGGRRGQGYRAPAGGSATAPRRATHKYRLTLEYDGTNYHGWQTQKNARTVQGTLYEAARALIGADVDIQGAGRTDGGVHALAQVAHLGTPVALVPRRLREGLNDSLPPSINVLDVAEVTPDFHARHDAVARSYLYVISRRRTAFAKRYVWWVKGRLDVTRMAKALAEFRGMHDFAAFADKHLDKGLATLVKIEEARLIEQGELIILRVVSSHFLWKMMRRMTGIVVAAGHGELGPGDVEAMLQHPSELPARHTAPPSGLFLEAVLYPGDRLPTSLPMLPLTGLG